MLIAVPGNAGPKYAARVAAPWTGTWSTGPTEATPDTAPLPADCTVRQVVHLSLGGAAPRVHLTNRYGPERIRFGEVWIGVRAGDPDSTAMWPGTIRPVTFDGRTEGRLPAWGDLVSDPVPDLPLAPGADLVISFHLPERTRTGTLSPHSFQHGRVLTGNVAAAPAPPAGAVITRYVLLGGVSVRTAGPSSAVVAFGDSITCGTQTTLDADRRWPDLLAARVRAAGLPLGVLNAGIGGNRLLTGAEVRGAAPVGALAQATPPTVRRQYGPAGLRRFDPDVLDQPGVSHVITLIGVNDIGSGGATAEALIAGHRALLRRSRAAGLSVVGGTLLPFGGSMYDEPAHRSARLTLNRWIREGGEFDAVADFDAAVRDGADPERLAAAYDSGDHLHPNDAGMLALAGAVPLTALSPVTR
ncbi:hypothetical protein ACWT_2458 [Actinoplanes sp. SE50]|uniref:SGNH/GDSL hydrolase family protein n=1 Tax=unclassified Actinoplanes TaxID=2626549 RepID=UPI00023EBED4|nr:MULTISPECIES: SGNH/GDSL hydrolase family protein [unclassified Actinoplanes]AEV83480.1 hypothetical protein ACPL_2585 [Actinoplanes sp. SE50/110]ATO81873.1 hypothetical protein ACWT_2458 [Actinoplanes sp. SE50]SLL99281.1 hypothetical protein ACSP50_2512 [Actinoplanes sp. SE50/110]